MIFGVVLQQAGGAPESPYNTQIGKPGETLEELAGRMEAVAEQNRKAYPQYHYRTLVGEFTHEIEPPKPIAVKVKPLKKVKAA